MLKIIRWLMRFGRLSSSPEEQSCDRSGQLTVEALVQAHGAWLALLATILERERIITGAELSRTLSEFAALTSEDCPAEGQILNFWAARLQDTAVTIRDLPSVH